MKHNYKVTFEYHDSFSISDKWSTQCCYVSANTPEEAVQACKDFYGLDLDPECEYRILSVEHTH